MIHYVPFSDLLNSAEGLIKIKTRIKAQFVNTCMSAQDCYNEYIVKTDDLDRV